MKEHKLKTERVFLEAIASGEKTWDIRNNDRHFQRGDVVTFREYRNPYSGIFAAMAGEKPPAPLLPEVRKRIGWIMHGPCRGLEEGYCIFSLEDVPA